MSKMKIKNVSHYKILINLENVRYRRELMPGVTATLPSDEVIEEFNYDAGCTTFVNTGFLRVILEDDEGSTLVESVQAAPIDADIDVLELLQKGSVADLAKALKDASPALKEKVVDIAIKHSILDAPRVKLIEAHCGIDILKAVSLQHSIEN